MVFYGFVKLGLNGYQKRYGFVYVDREEEEGATLDRYKKDSFYWYQDVIKQDGENLFNIINN